MLRRLFPSGAYVRVNPSFAFLVYGHPWTCVGILNWTWCYMKFPVDKVRVTVAGLWRNPLVSLARKWPQSHPFAYELESLAGLHTRNCRVSSPHISIMHISNYCSSKLCDDVPFTDPHQSAHKAHDPSQLHPKTHTLCISWNLDMASKANLWNCTPC